MEDYDQQGLEHFVEHMAFNGTKSFPKQEIIDFLGKYGVRFGPQLTQAVLKQIDSIKLKQPDQIYID
jgi:predicted Zn-dependent peptidase